MLVITQQLRWVNVTFAAYQHISELNNQWVAEEGWWKIAKDTTVSWAKQLKLILNIQSWGLITYLRT